MYDNILKDYAREWRTEHPETSRLIAQAMFDLYYGPGCPEEDYPGFEAACRAIREELPAGPAWYAVDLGWWVSDEPEACDDCEWVEFSPESLVRAIVGRELFGYVR